MQEAQPHVLDIESDADALDQTNILKQMKRLGDLTRAVISTLDLENVFQQMCRMVVRLINVDHSGLVLFDQNHEQGWVQAEFPELGVLHRQIPVRGISAEERLILTQAPLQFDDVSKAEGLGAVAEIWNELGIRSILIIPIVIKGRVIGSLSLDSTQTLHTFTRDEVELCQLFLAQITPAIENAQLYAETQEWERRTREQKDQLARTMTAARHLARLMVAGDLNATLEAIAESAKEALGCDIVVLYRYDPVAHQFDYPPVVTDGLRYPDAIVRESRVLPDSIVFKLLRRTGPKTVPDVSSDPDFSERRFARDEKIASVIVLPLECSHRKVGVLFANYHQPREFSPEQVELAQFFADQAAIAIDNAAFEQTLTKLYESAKSVSGKSTLNQTLQQIAERAGNLIDRHQPGDHWASYIALLENNQINFLAAYPSTWLPILNNQHQIHRTSSRRGIIGRAIWERRRYQKVGNVHTDPDYIEVDPQINSQLVVVIKSGDEIIGALGIEHCAPDAFTAADVKKIKMLGAQAAIAIEKARALDETAWRASQLQAVLDLSRQVGSSTDLNQTLVAACRAAVELLKVDHSGLVLFDDHEVEATVRAEYPPTEISGTTIPLRGIPIEEELIEKRATIFVPDAMNEPRLGSLQDVFRKLGTRALLLVPILANGKLIGSFGLDVIGKDRAFRPEEQQLCETFAAQMGVAIERARLYERAKQDAEDLARLTRANQERAHFIDLLEHQHFNVPGFALSTLDLLFQGDLGEVRLDERQRAKLERVQDELRRYKRFQESLRQSGHPYGGERALERESFSMQEIVDEVVQVLRADAEAKAMTIQVECSDAGCVRANFDMLLVALTHIVENAIKFSPSNRLITIRLTMHDNWVQVQVDDQGCGVNIEMREHLGQPGFRGNPQIPGMGLGLAFATKFVALNGGQVTFPIKDEPGFRVMVSLPAEPV
ncbi:MAG: GAF domain-containing protein [Chloroflexi bacterium]|nr:GAF domain-containing protein [Chloroflexota bacterium]